MSEALRPLSVGEILDRTISLYKSRFPVFFGIAAVPAAVVLGFGGMMVALFAWAATAGPAAGIAIGMGGLALTLLGMPLLLGANALSGAALCDAASTLRLGGTISISSAFKAVWKRGWSYVGLYLLLTLILFAAPMAAWVVLTMGVAVLAIVAGANGAAFSAALLMLGGVGTTVVVLWLLVRVCLAYPVAVAERAGVGVALKRAWGLSEGTRWRILVLLLLAMVLYCMLTFMLMVPLTAAIAMLPGLNSAQHAQTAGTVMIIGFYGGSFAVQALTMPVIAIALVLFYYDQRVRREGFDIEMLMRQAGMVSDSVAELEAAPWMPGVLPRAPAIATTASPEGAPATENAAALDTVPAQDETAVATAEAEHAMGSETERGAAHEETSPDATGDEL